MRGRHKAPAVGAELRAKDAWVRKHLLGAIERLRVAERNTVLVQDRQIAAVGAEQCSGDETLPFLQLRRTPGAGPDIPHIERAGRLYREPPCIRTEPDLCPLADSDLQH